MHIIFRFIIRIQELLNFIYIKITCFNSVSLCIGGGYFKTHKYTEILFETKKSKIYQYGNFFARDFLKIRMAGGVLTVGKNCFFNNYCSVTCMGSIEIGNSCIFGENVKLYDHNHNYKESETLIVDQGFSIGKIIIEDNCWIGSNVVILKDVRIGSGCIIGAGCVVYNDIPSNTIMLSNGTLRKK